jgi:predicted pyridoxine 5'-phosphate oxidase superfamily flavin-nucleotide-binding protein
LNGEAERRPDAIYVATQRVYVNCPKYIQARVLETSGSDASRRGGSPGFVRFVDENTLELPNYSGNTMFNTLGNIAANPSAGLLFLDFERGDTLQITGEARVF